MIIGAAVRVGEIILAVPNPLRHSDAIRMMERLNLDESVAFDWGKGQNQGFVDEYGKYYNRTEAAKHAFDCGQLKVELSAVCSEDLW